MAEMVVRVGADVNGAVQGMNLVQQRVQYLENSIKFFQDKLANTQSQKFYANALDIIARKKKELAQITRATGGSLEKTANQTNRATQSMTDLSRIVQDAPYGFNAIANNLNPLLESFGRLKASTGSTGGAIRALTASLTGPAGIGIAVATASTLFLKFGDSLFNIGKSSKETEESTKSLAEGVASELVKLTSLVGLAGNVNASYENRAKAIKALNDQYGKYLPGLNEEKITLDNLSTAYDTITESLLRQAVIKGSQAQIEQIVAETAKKIIALRLKEKEAVNDSAEAYKKQQNAAKFNESNEAKFQKYVKSVEQGNGVIRDGAIALEQNKIAQTQQIRSVNIYDVLVKNLTEDLKDQLKPLMDITTEFNDLDQSLKKGGKSTENFRIEANKLSKEMAEMLNQKAFDAEKLRIAISGVIIEPKPTFFEQLQSQTTEKIAKAFPEAFKPKLAVEIDPQIEKFGKEFVKGINDIESAISQIQTDALINLVSSIGEAIGGGNLSNIFQSFVDTIAGGIVAIGKQMIALGVKAQLLKKALASLFTNPIALIAAGVGLVAVGSAIRGALGKGIEGREKGGPVTGNTPYIVGERGPELFVPSVAGSIIPNNRLNAFNGRPAFAGGMGGRSIVRGSDILLSYARTQRSQSRVNG